MVRRAWVENLNLDVAAGNLHTEMLRDWHHDPWGWPEIEFLARVEPEIIHQHCLSAGSQQAFPIEVPKENWSTRPAVVLDIADRVLYQALVDSISVDIVGTLSPNTFGWRLPAISPAPGEYSNQDLQWHTYTGHLNRLATFSSTALRTDITSFFASVPINAVHEDIQDRATPGAHLDRLHSLIDGFQTIPGRLGLPQRSTASAVIANMFLNPIDDVLTSHASSAPNVFKSKLQYHSFARWMDDIWLFTQNPASARAAQKDLQSVARNLGLNLNIAKTEVLEGDDVAKQALEIEHSAIDDAITENSNFVPLEELIDGLLEDREKASRSSINFASVRMRKYDHFYRLDDLLELAPRMPHVADAWAKLLKKAKQPELMQEWFVEYAGSEWAMFPWSLSHFARLFPSGFQPNRQLIEYFTETVVNAGASLPILAVAVQRLCAWNPTAGRAACHAAYQQATDPHVKRILALGSLQVGQGRNMIRRWVSADKENYPTLRMLEHRNFTPPVVSKFFSG
ncbi:RNA-directed DNA polymerase [Actinokineospora sp. NBRC 105648]|uniref:RNA-directed DNA polymerase n=1 Tax=Actinokineospora sp. NBRC 105648 TaxID=3032206 RepID=UPI002555402B|nr:RNA-directed DNA polymerase [Actinokineospora sp. NBRC 105648]